jgi:hypothetical protein
VESEASADGTGEPYGDLDGLLVKGRCGSNCRIELGVRGVPGVWRELSKGRLSSIFPPLPELTVMCNGDRDGVLSGMIDDR